MSPRFRFRSSIRVVAVLALTSLVLSGCFKDWDLQEVKEWYDEKPSSFEDYMRLGRQRQAEGRIDNAVKLYQDAILDLEGQFGPNDLRIATAAEELGILQEKRGMNVDAEQSFRKALTVRLNGLPANHFDVKRSRQKLAGVLKKLYKDKEAKEVLYGTPDTTPSTKSGGKDSDKPQARFRRHKRT